AIIHDATLDRTAQADSPLRTGAVSDLTRAQLDRVLVGEDQHIPTLPQVLDAAVREDGTRVPVMVEIKAPEAADLVARILQERFEPSSWQDPSGAPALVLSFHEEPLRRTREIAPQIPLMRTTKATSLQWWQSCRDLGVAHVGVRIADARHAGVGRAAAVGASLNLWTARTDAALARALELGCDTLTVDDPAWARAQIARRAAPRSARRPARRWPGDPRYSASSEAPASAGPTVVPERCSSPSSAYALHSAVASPAPVSPPSPPSTERLISSGPRASASCSSRAES